MENQQKKGAWSKASKVLGIISIIFALLPLASAWCMILTAFNYVLAPIGILCGIVALCKSQNSTTAIIGIVLCALAIFAPYLLAEYYVESAASSIGNLMKLV